MKLFDWCFSLQFAGCYYTCNHNYKYVLHLHRATHTFPLFHYNIESFNFVNIEIFDIIDSRVFPVLLLRRNPGEGILNRADSGFRNFLQTSLRCLIPWSWIPWQNLDNSFRFFPNISLNNLIIDSLHLENINSMCNL